MPNHLTQTELGEAATTKTRVSSKKAYCPPTLSSYGKLNDLTKGGFGAGGDGGGAGYQAS